MDYQAIERHRKVLNVYYWVKETNLRRLHILLFQLLNILKKAKLWIQWKDQWLLEIKDRWIVQKIVRGFSEFIPYNNIRVDTYQRHLSKPIEHTTHQTSVCISLSRRGLHSNDYLQYGDWKLKFLAEHFADFC